MLSPEYILKLSYGAEELAGEMMSAVMAQVIRRLMVRLHSEDEIKLSATDVYQLRTLEEAGILRKDIIKVIQKYTKKQKAEIQKAFEDAGLEAVKADNEIYRRAGLSETALTTSPHLTRLLQRNFEATMGLWDNYTRTTADVVQQSFIQECSRTYNEVASTVIPYNVAIMQSINRLIAQDVESVLYTHPDGTVHRDTVEVATFRAVRTGVNQACAQITSQIAHDDGIFLFGTSAHIGARPTHYVWQGKVFWVDWEELNSRVGVNFGDPIPAPEWAKEKYDEFCEATDIGSVTGLCGANCRHSYYPFIEGLDYVPFQDFDSEENAERYNNEQKARAKERAIRKLKKRMQSLEEALKNPPNEAVRKKLLTKHNNTRYKLVSRNEEYREFCKQHGLKAQELRLYVG